MKNFIKDLWKCFTTKQGLKITLKILVGVAVLVAVVYFGANALIYKSADLVAEAYTGEIHTDLR